MQYVSVCRMQMMQMSEPKISQKYHHTSEPLHMPNKLTVYSNSQIFIYSSGYFSYWNTYYNSHANFILDETKVSHDFADFTQRTFTQDFVSVLQKVLLCDHPILTQTLIWLKFLSLQRFLRLWLKHWLNLKLI